MISYGISIRGKSHIKRNIPCQDAHQIRHLDNGWMLAVIADGVGSAENSQIGSKIAVETIASFCDEHLPIDDNNVNVKSMLRTAYNYAYKKILEEAYNSKNPIDSYDTTLTTVLYSGQRIVYAHSGDGAIIGLDTKGNYVTITNQKKGIDGISVLPLRSGYRNWEIDSYEDDLVAVILVTDGLFDALSPPLLRSSESDLKIYTPLAEFFADPRGFKRKGNEKTIFEFLKGRSNYDTNCFYKRLQKIYKSRVPENYKEIINSLKMNDYPVKLIQGVNDDKTIVVLVSKDIILETKDGSYYMDPDWEHLTEEWNKKAYPHLYENSSENNTTPKAEKEN